MHPKGDAASPDLPKLLATMQATTVPNVSQEAVLRRRLRAAASLKALAEEEKWRPELMMVGAIRPIVALLSDSLPEIELAAAKILRPLAATEACRASILAANVLPRLVAMAYYGIPDTREEAAAVLGALASPEQYKARVLAAGAVPALVDVLESCCLQSQAADAASEVAASVEASPRMMIGTATMATVASSAEVLSTGTIGKRQGGRRQGREAAATLCKLAFDSEETKLAIVQEDAIPALVQLLSCSCKDTCLEVMRLLGELCDLTEGRAAIAESGALLISAEASQRISETSMPVPKRGGIVVPIGEPGGPLVDLLHHPDADVQAEAAAVVAALGTRRENPLEPGDAPAFDGAALILAAGTLHKLVDMLSTGNSRGRTQAARAMFGIASPEVESNRNAIVVAGSLLPLVAILRSREVGSAEARAWAASTLRLLASSPARRRTIEEAVPVVAPHGRLDLMAQIHAYCF